MSDVSLPSPSDTGDDAVRAGTDWPEDRFTRMVTGSRPARSLAVPARHSYDGDGTMEAIDAFPPFSSPEDRSDIGAYTGAVGS